MLAGLIRDDERTTLEGIAGLSDIPVIGHLFGHTKSETQQTDIVLMLTPRIVRVLDLDVEATCARSGSAVTRAAASTSCRCPHSSRSRRPRRRRRRQPARRHLPAGDDAGRPSRPVRAADQPADDASAGDAADDAADARSSRGDARRR